MSDWTLENAGAVDEAALTEQLKSELGADAITGVSVVRGTLVVHHAHDADPLLIRSAVVNHLKEAPALLLEKAQAQRARREATDAAVALIKDDDAWAAANSDERTDALRAILLRRL